MSTIIAIFTEGEFDSVHIERDMAAAESFVRGFNLARDLYRGDQSSAYILDKNTDLVDMKQEQKTDEVKRAFVAARSHLALLRPP